MMRAWLFVIVVVVVAVVGCAASDQVTELGSGQCVIVQGGGVSVGPGAGFVLVAMVAGGGGLAAWWIQNGQYIAAGKALEDTRVKLAERQGALDAARERIKLLEGEIGRRDAAIAEIDASRASREQLEQRVRELDAQGKSRYAICKAVFGYAGGRAWRFVDAVVNDGVGGDVAEAA